MSTKHSDTKPYNARIHIDYETNQVHFNYPTEKDSFLRRMVFVSPLVFIAWFITLVVYSITKSIIFILLNPPVLSTALTDGASAAASVSALSIMIFLIDFIISSLDVIDLVALPLIASVVMAHDYSFFSEFFPKANYWMHKYLFRETTKLYEFEANQVINNIIEIPFMENVYLEFNATRDVSKYLKNVDIIEHPFQTQSFGKPHVNELVWKAVFTFTKTPETGKLYVSCI